MINAQKLKINDPLDEILSEINPRWKSQELYAWQWDDFDRKRYDPMNAADISDFARVEHETPEFVVYHKEGRFMLFTEQGNFYHVLTNIPSKDMNGVDAPDSADEHTINKLYNIIFR